MRRPINWSALRADEAERLIRARARDRSNVVFTMHAFDRSDERSIGPEEIYRILDKGVVLQPPRRLENGDWQAIVEARIRDDRDACAVTVIVRDDRSLVVRTTMWKDL